MPWRKDDESTVSISNHRSGRLRSPSVGAFPVTFGRGVSGRLRSGRLRSPLVGASPVAFGWGISGRKSARASVFSDAPQAFLPFNSLFVDSNLRVGAIDTIFIVVSLQMINSLPVVSSSSADDEDRIVVFEPSSCVRTGLMYVSSFSIFDRSARCFLFVATASASFLLNFFFVPGFCTLFPLGLHTNFHGRRIKV